MSACASSSPLALRIKERDIQNHESRDTTRESHIDTKSKINIAHIQRPKTPAKKPAKATDRDPPGHKFQPHDLSTAPTIPSNLPPELWTIVQSAPANFAPQFFLDASRNLLENPNLTASHLARAELSYQSFADATFNPKAKTAEELASIVKHLRPECRPQLVEDGIPGYELEWTVVRKLIPRNPNLDDPLMQTCHLFVSHEDISISVPKSTGPASTSTSTSVTVPAQRFLVLYLPHATSPDAIPYYHPKVRALAMLYTYLSTPNLPSSTQSSPQGTLSIHYSPFPTHPLDTRLSRTALKLLETIHKHARGNAAGYKKRVLHDQLVPQKAFQDTYAALKARYAKALIETWVEQTPAEKHVFEDLGIAAFLVQIWTRMYAPPSGEGDEEEEKKEEADEWGSKASDAATAAAQRRFPGFVDIGCGNGLLVYILNAEGWQGWGFDARKRKTWDTFPVEDGEGVKKLRQLLLVPAILKPRAAVYDADVPLLPAPPPFHNGVFPNGTFIISNHADELTPWTPLLAYLSRSPFIAIPCCSHDFGGTRFRAPVCSKYVMPDAATGPAKNKLPSAYASLVSWVSHLTEAVGYKVEKEHLRIPSTRNVAVLGRTRLDESQRQDAGMEERMTFVRELVEKETGNGTTVEHLLGIWMKSGGSLMNSSKGGH